jgi:hypothetical protein
VQLSAPEIQRQGLEVPVLTLYKPTRVEIKINKDHMHVCEYIAGPKEFRGISMFPTAEYLNIINRVSRFSGHIF